MDRPPGPRTSSKAVVVRPVSQFLAGAGLLVRGCWLCLRDRRLVLLGILPALLTGALFTAALVALLVFLGPETAGLTWFAGGWSPGWRDLLRVLAGIAVVGAFLLLAIVAYTAVTLVIGEPFYEKISDLVEERCGGLPGAVDVPWWRGFWRGITEAVRLLLFSLWWGIVLFLAGFLPLVGQTVVPAVGALVGGWVLALELTAAPFARRDRWLRERRLVLRRHRYTALGFGTAVFLCCLVPLGAVLVMPAAVAGATLLARRVCDPTDRPAA